MVPHYKALFLIADQMCSWEEVQILGIWVGIEPREVMRLQNENNSIRRAAYQILESCCRNDAISDIWKNIKEALLVIKKNTAVKELGIEQLISPEIDAEEIREENQRLKNARLCKVCKDEDANQLFLPCSHLVSDFVSSATLADRPKGAMCPVVSGGVQE